MKRICVFCGSSKGSRSLYIETAREMGKALARRGLGLVYGGGCVGLMGEMADAAMAAGASVIGVIPQALVDREVAHHGITELRTVRSMHDRKAMMMELSDAFIALPGGYGTFEELCEVITWAQLGLHNKPCSILNVGGYYDPLLAQFERCVSEGFIHPAARDLVVQETSPDGLLDLLETYKPPIVEKWIDRDES